MSLSDNYQPDVSIGNGTTLIFTGSWKVFNAEYFRMILQDIASGLQTVLTLGSDYTLVIDPDGGYTATLLIPAPSSAYYIIRARDVALTQTNPYRTSKGFQGLVIEDSFDKLTAIAQDMQDRMGRSLTFQIGSTAIGYMIEDPINGRALKWDTVNSRIINSTYDPDTLYQDAEGFAIAAQASANTAMTQAGIATSQATLAQSWAIAPIGTRPEGSAKYWAEQALINGGGAIAELTGDVAAVGPSSAVAQITDQFTGGFRKMYEKVSRTIASGVIDVNSTAKTVEIVVDTEGGSVLDDLTSITGGIIGQELILRTTSSARDVVVVNNQVVGGIYLPDAKNVLLATDADRLTVVYQGNTNGLGTWVQKSLSKITDAGTYEQGDWTPTIEGTTVAGVQTYGSVVGKYIRVGNMVTVSGRVAISAKGGTMAGNVKVGGLPFLVGNGAYSSMMPYSTGVTLTSGEWLNCIFNGGNDYFLLFKNNGLANAALTVANIANATEFRFNLTYYIGT